MKRILSALPVWIVLADMLYGFVLNAMQSFAPAQSGGASSAPEVAFSSLQLLANGGMIAVVGFGLLVLLRLNRSVSEGRAMPIGVLATLGLIAVLAFSLPSWWEWFGALLSLMGGTPALSFENPRYFWVALCLPYLALLCVWRLAGWYRLAKAQGFDEPDAEERWNKAV
ncbi:MAG: hypothetical protein Q4D82_08330 [Neisseria sp.]|nr:hypothetical protein [Neisseria sp.]